MNSLAAGLHLVARSAWLAAGLSALAAVPVPAVAESTASQAYLQRMPQDEIIYLIMPDRFENGDRSNDRGGLKGARGRTGFDPTAKNFFHGGDLKGVLKRLDYIQGLGATAVWLTPVMKNGPVQAGPGESAPYHGYAITDFTHVDPHFGTDADFKKLVDAVHTRGMKFYMDIVVNHTGNVIRYRECPARLCPYRSRADYPYTREGGMDGKPINDGFMGDAPQYQTPENFAKLTNPNYAYHVVIPKGEEHVKVPDWLNDPIYYHNRGASTFTGESSTMGDFFGLDDVYTENPRVVQGMIDIYGAWIDKYHVDGFRIDTEKHVNPEFWQTFVPAILARAKADGIPNFHIFGEVMLTEVDAGQLARHTREDRIPSVMDYAFAAAVQQTVAGNAGTDVLARLFADDVLYEDGAATARQNATLIGNYDIGRFAWFVRKGLPQAPDDEVLKRVLLGQAMMFTLRGVPTVYYGDEQGFPGTGPDEGSREDMSGTKVPQYENEKPLGTGSKMTGSHFDTAEPIYKAIQDLAKLRTQSPALRRGKQIVRNYSEKPGIFAVSRIDPDSGREMLVAFNTSTEPLDVQVEVDAASTRFQSLRGTCAPAPSAPGSYHVSLKPLDFVVCAAEEEK